MTVENSSFLSITLVSRHAGSQPSRSLSFLNGFESTHSLEEKWSRYKFGSTPRQNVGYYLGIQVVLLLERETGNRDPP